LYAAAPSTPLLLPPSSQKLAALQARCTQLVGRLAGEEGRRRAADEARARAEAALEAERRRSAAAEREAARLRAELEAAARELDVKEAECALLAGMVNEAQQAAAAH